MSMRIVSLVPSLTETICEAGLGSALVGCTNYCMHPAASLSEVSRVGGTKDPDLKKIQALKPTHVLFSKEENLLNHYEKIESDIKFVADVHAVSQVPSMLRSMAASLDCNEELTKMGSVVADLIEKRVMQPPSQDAVYFIWREPWMVASKETYIGDALKFFGKHIKTSPLIKIEGSDANRYPVFSTEDLVGGGALLFSSEPYSFKKRHIETFFQEYPTDTWEPYLCDGKILSWYGYSTKLLLEADSSSIFRRVEI